jgi:hypothetical protein
MLVEAESVLAWRDELNVLKDRLGPLFIRPEPRQQAGLYLEGLLSGAERKNGWQLAEQIGDARPWRTQRVLSHVQWDQDAARDICRDYVIEHIGRPDGVLVVDETGFLKKGTHSAGVARQYSGTAGRIENCQIGVFLTYVSSRGHALIDRALYLPEAWCADTGRRVEAAIPEDVMFATKPALATQMIARALDAGIPCGWVLGDEVYGSDHKLRRLLEQRQQPYVLTVRSNEKLWTVLAKKTGWYTAAELAEACPASAWQCHSAGAGTKGERFYDWTRLPLARRPGRLRHTGCTGCWSGAIARIRTSWPITWPSPRRTPALPRWPVSPACVGRSRNASRWPSRRLVWPTMRFAPGTAGIATSRWPCWPSPSWWPCGSSSTHGHLQPGQTRRLGRWSLLVWAKSAI